MADRIALSADFFSFGTNDLTQTTFGLSRDDAGRFLPEYVEKRLFDVDPFTVLDEDSPRLLKLAEDFLDVEGIPLALLREDLEKLLGDFLRGEQGPDHSPDVAGTETLEGDRLRQRRGEPRRCVARPRRQHQ